MKVLKGAKSVKVPEAIGEIVSIGWDAGVREMRGPLYMLALIPMADLMEKRENSPQLVGRPVLAAYDHMKLRLHIFPASDTRGDLRVHYFPAMKEF